MSWTSRYVVADGIRTHVLEAGHGPDVVLVHSGEFGASAELSWEHCIDALADRFHVVAPDLVGYGATDKVRDFLDGHGRIVRHLAALLRTLGIDEAHFVGNSMGATYLVRDAASPRPLLPARSLVLASGGGHSPDNEARRILLDYDCTLESMRAVVGVLFHDESWAADEAYVARRHRSSLVPGAWECAASARFRSPVASPRSDFGGTDSTPYEAIRVPVQLVAGADDPLRERGYADGVAARIPGGRAVELDRCGHCPNIEQSARFNELVLDFLSEVEATP